MSPLNSIFHVKNKKEKGRSELISLNVTNCQGGFTGSSYFVCASLHEQQHQKHPPHKSITKSHINSKIEKKCNNEE